MPGEVFHWTVSLIPSINCFSSAGGVSLQTMLSAWEEQVTEGPLVILQQSTAKLVADLYAKYGLLERTASLSGHTGVGLGLTATRNVDSNSVYDNVPLKGVVEGPVLRQACACTFALHVSFLAVALSCTPALMHRSEKRSL